MCLSVNFLQVGDGEMHIGLCAGHLGVPQHFLDMPQVGAVLNEMGRERGECEGSDLT